MTSDNPCVSHCFLYTEAPLQSKQKSQQQNVHLLIPSYADSPSKDKLPSTFVRGHKNVKTFSAHHHFMSFSIFFTIPLLFNDMVLFRLTTDSCNTHAFFL